MKEILNGAPAREKREQMVDLREERIRPAAVAGEVRADDENVLDFSGYASTFEPYEMYGGPAKGGWIEQVDRGAFDKTLKAKPDLQLLVNHGGMPLARTKSGTLTLSVDDGGLKTFAPLDRSDPDVQRLEPKMRRKDMDEMSFAFRVVKQRWDYAPDFEDDPYGLRIIEELSLHKGDVSIVNYGANPTTSAELKGIDDALAMLAECGPEALAEARSASGEDIIRRATAALDMLTRGRKIIDLGARAEKPTKAPAAEAKSAPKGDKSAPVTGRKPISVADAYRRMGYGSEDGTLLSTGDALTLTGSAPTDSE